MNIDKKKLYIKKFVITGLSFSKACELTYCTEEDIDTIEADKAFIADLNDVKMELTLRRMEDYNAKVDMSVQPNDELKRFATIMDVINTDSLDMPGDLNLTIIKQRGDK